MLPMLLLHPSAVLLHYPSLDNPKMSFPLAMPCAIEMSFETTCFVGHRSHCSTSYKGVQVTSHGSASPG